MQSLKEFLKGFEEHFNEVEDPRQQSKISHSLLEILFLAVVAIASGASSWSGIEMCGRFKLKQLRRYYTFTTVPSKHTIRRVFEVIDPEQLNKILQQYFSINTTSPHYAIDGKSLRGSRYADSRALHFLNVYAASSGVTIFGKVLDKKQNEISGMPEALEIIDIKNAVITIDAMGCQKSIAATIIAKGGDYVFGLKKNHMALYSVVQKAFSSEVVAFCAIDIAETQEKGHGRVELRRCRTIHNVEQIHACDSWPGIKSIVEIYRRTVRDGKVTECTNYYISSLSKSAKEVMKIIRSHWGVEAMHWAMDVVFKEDANHTRTDNSPANLAIIRRFVFNILTLIKNTQPKKQQYSKPLMMMAINLSNEYLNKFVNMINTYS